MTYWGRPHQKKPHRNDVLISGWSRVYTSKTNINNLQTQALNIILPADPTSEANLCVCTPHSTTALNVSLFQSHFIRSRAHWARENQTSGFPASTLIQIIPLILSFGNLSKDSMRSATSRHAISRDSHVDYTIRPYQREYICRPLSPRNLNAPY